MTPARWPHLLGSVTFSDTAPFLCAALLIGLGIEYWRRRRAERELDAAKERIRFAVESTDMGSWEWSAADDRITPSECGRIHFGLDAASELSREEFIARIHPDDQAVLRRCFEIQSREQPRFDVEVRVPVANRTSPRWVACHGTVHFNAAGRAEKIFAVSHDCTSRRHQHELVEQQRDHLAHLTRIATLGQLTASLSHEIMQPLTAILSNAQAAKHRISGEQLDLLELNRILDDIIADDRRAGEIVHRLNNMARRTPPDSKPVALPEIIQEVAGLLRSEFVHQGVTLNLDLAPGLPLVCGDRVQLQQVLVNLLVNAAESVSSARLPQRMVWVRTRSLPESEIELVVADSGSGFRPAQLAASLAPFQSSKPHGLGIGLWISATILESHRGRLRLSNHPMGGAVITITMPTAGTPTHHV